MSPVFARGYRIPTSVPHAPTDLDTIDDGELSGMVILKWIMPSQTIAYTGFHIYRADSSDGTYTLVGSTTESDYETYYLDTPPYSFPTVYWYKVTAYNSKGESVASNIVSGTRR